MSEMLRDEEVQISIPPASIFPGFRFSPTDEELISYYLNKKLEGSQKCVEVISEVEINKYEPWDLPAKSVIQSENEWFFFSPRGRKYPNGSQSKRATESGYWKATGKERNVKSGSNVIGTKRTLVFHVGRAPKGERTEWIMHEYSMSGRSLDSLVICRLRRNSDFRLNDSPRQSSSSQRNFPTENNGHFNLSEIGVEHSGLVEGAKAVECCSKDGSSSYNSHSVEQQVDSGYERDQKLMSEFSQLGSSSHQDHDYEECYADILKDDIVDLGKPLLTPTHDLLRPFGDQTKQQQPVLASPLSFVPPLQGTANRRIKLSWQILENNQTEQVEIEPRNVDLVEELMPPSKGHPPSTCVFSFLSHQSLGRCYLYIVFGVLSMLVLFVSMWGVPCQVKRFMRIS